MAGNPVTSPVSPREMQTPSAQPAGTTLPSKSIDGELNAMLFGSGIGARIKAAIHALPNDCYSRWDIFTEHTGGQASLRQHQGSWRCQHDYQLDPNVRGSLCACRPCGIIPSG